MKSIFNKDKYFYVCFFFSGHGDRGQLGLGHRVLSAEHFEQVPGLPKHVVAIAAGEAHTAILSARGDMYVFGDGKHGKLGSTTYSNEFEPCLVDKFKTYNVSKVVCGGCQTIILAKKRSPGQNKSSESEEDIGSMYSTKSSKPNDDKNVLSHIYSVLFRCNTFSHSTSKESGKGQAQSSVN